MIERPERPEREPPIFDPGAPILSDRQVILGSCILAILLFFVVLIGKTCGAQ
jgi:hypothetical protein